MSETFDYAFRPLAEGGAGLDFITLSDYVMPTARGARSAATRATTRAS